MPTGRRFWMIALVLVAVCAFSGCGGVNWSVTPYAGVSGNTDDDYYSGVNWTAGMSVTFYSGRYPAPPAVVNPPPVYRNEVSVNNEVSNSSSSSSSSNSTSSATQSQNQEQNQSQNQSQSQEQTGGGGSSGGDDDDCGHPGHGHGHGHGHEHGHGPDHDEDHDD